MASRTTPARSTGPDAGGAVALRAEAERLIAKERYKDAVKQAKLCYKEQASPDHHRLLERAYFLRARQLVQQGMRSSAVEVAQHLIDFGITGSDAPDELVRLLAGLGLEQAALSVQERLGSPELKEQVARTVADQLVIHPGRPGAAAPELVREAGLVRRALEAIQAGDEAGATAILRDLPRSSMLSEWKFFVRGLSAFQRDDDGEARANWDRLEPTRAPAAIAGRLRALAESPEAPEAIERHAFGDPILARLKQLGDRVAAQDWDRALSLLGPLRVALRRVDPALPERLTRVLIASLIKSVQEMDWHGAGAGRPVLPPGRADGDRPALESPLGPDLGRSPGRARRGHPLLVRLPAGPRDPRGPHARAAPLAQAMVWNHVAELHREEWEALRDMQEGPPSLRALRKRKKPAPESPEVAEARKAAAAAVEQSLALAPDYLDSYRLLVALHRDWEDDAGLAAAAGRLLARFPEDVETLELLARHHYLGRDDPAAAFPYIERARRLRPLDDSLRDLEWLIRVGLARAFAMKKKWDAGRAEFAAAEALCPEVSRDFSHLARRAMLEYRAGQDEAGDRYVTQAGELLVEPAPLLLALLIHSIRFKMPKARTDEYTRRWDAELKKKKRGETAGEMAALLSAFLRSGVEYTGRAGHITKAVTYLRGTTRLKFRREDIEHVVEFLGELSPREDALATKLVRAGLKQHPGSVRLHVAASAVEAMDAGLGFLFGRSCASEPRRHLETAPALAEASTDPKDTALVPAIRERLGRLDEIEQAAGRFGFPFGPGSGPDFFDDFDDFDEYDDWMDDDGWDAEEEPPAPGPAPRPRRPAKPKGGRRKKKR